MIEYLAGVLRFKEPQHVVVDVMGVGYGLDVPASTYERMGAVGEAVELYTYHYVREDQIELFGFATPQEREVFEIFINTSGIGPKTSLGILSSIPIGDFARAIMESNLSVLMRIPGVGRKTAERLVVELRDKMKAFLLGVEAAGAELAKRPPQIADAIDALTHLGTPRTNALRAVGRAAEKLGDGASAQDLIVEALKYR